MLHSLWNELVQNFANTCHLAIVCSGQQSFICVKIYISVIWESSNTFHKNVIFFFNHLLDLISPPVKLPLSS